MFCYLLFLFSNKSWVPLHVKKIIYVSIYPELIFWDSCIVFYHMGIVYFTWFVLLTTAIWYQLLWRLFQIFKITTYNTNTKVTPSHTYLCIYANIYTFFFFFAYKQQTFISYSLRGCEVQGQDTSRVSDWWVSTSGSSTAMFSLCPNMMEGPSFIRALIEGTNSIHEDYTY